MTHDPFGVTPSDSKTTHPAIARIIFFSGRNGYLLRDWVALLFVVSASLKYQMISNRSWNDSHSNFEYWLTQTVIVIEILLAAAIVARIRELLVDQILSVLLLVFAIYQTFMVATGKTSCGCMGLWEIPPTIMFALDISLATCFFVSSRCNWLNRCVVINPLRLIISFVVFLAIPYFLLISPNTSIEKSAIRLADIELKSYESIDPSQWVGSDFPISQFADESDCDLTNAQVILIVRDSCKKCHDLAKLLPERNTEKNKGVLVMLLDRLDRSTWNGFRTLKLKRDRDWLCPTPVVIRMERGVVRQVDVV